MVAPTSTYRLQLTGDFGFDDAAAQVPYLADLGITHLYCSPWLQAEPGSAHGYDVVDHGRVNSELGGAEGLARLSAACRVHGLGIVVDIVPNHMSVASPQRNAAWWSVLREGPASPYSGWFDISWEKGPLTLPLLGAPLEESLDQISVDGDRLRYYDHVLPLAEGSVVEGDLAATLAAQHYRLAFWRDSGDLSYRRFFDVTTLAGVRVEVPEVFDAVHATTLDQVRRGVVTGLRVDHPDGLADPAGYLERLRSEVPGTWTVVEKILEPGEALPSWECEGTTGYDAMHQVGGLFVEPSAEQAFTALWAGSSYGETRAAAKRQVLSQVLVAEAERLLDLAVPVLAPFGTTRPGLHEALVELLVAFEVYRAYLPAEGPADPVARALLAGAVRTATAVVPTRELELELLARLALAELGCPEFVTRFQQTCGPVMAKGVEDTTFYRYTRMVGLNEVGGDPADFGVTAAEFHAYCRQRLARWPLTMTALSTHDTKRSEDVRARLAVLTHDPSSWVETVERWSAAMPERLDRGTELLVWQTLLGAWPLSPERATDYLTKAVREAKQHTSWLDPDKDYEGQVASFARTAMATLDISAFVDGLAPAWRSVVLAQKLVQLTMPGVADCYQGTELVSLDLVDPDNRRPVDYVRRKAVLASPGHDLDSEKHQVVAAALRLRREHPDWFLEGSYEPLTSAADALAFARSDQVVVVVPLRGGEAPEAELPPGAWTDLLPGLPVSLLRRA
ncbi:MAG: treY [Frankiales bacterium]|nr:treY [Frankiales bacterium]